MKRIAVSRDQRELIIGKHLEGQSLDKISESLPYKRDVIWRIIKEYKSNSCSRSVVGVIGDTHLPFVHPGYLDFCQNVFALWRVTRVVHIGDFVDNHASSYHESDPDGLSAGDEYAAATEVAQEWYTAFPCVSWVTGNHDKIPQRKIRSAGLCARMLRENLYNTPAGWINGESFEIDGVLYTHGIGSAGINGHRLLAQKRGVSCVIGHLHTSAGVAYTATHDGLQRFGLNVGCGVDHESYAMDYARDFGRPTLGCGIVVEGVEAHFIPMIVKK
jgi:predicted phosphodiesterase